MIRTTILLGVWLGLAVCSIATAEEAAPAKPVKHVVLVSIDGMGASYLNDPRADLPNLRALARQGAAATGMVTSFPSVTWPCHTSLITGVVPAKHGVIGNGVWNRELNRGITYIGDPTLTKEESIRVPTLYDAAHAQGLSCGSVIWPCCNGAKSLRWCIPDSNKPELHAKYTTPGFVEELSKADIDITKLGEWGWSKERSHDRDIVYTRVANYLLEKHRVNLLLVHLITPDGVEHNVGPHTREAYQAVHESDQRIGEIWQTLQGPELKGQAALFVVSDHGFAPYEKNIRPNARLRELGLITVDAADKVTERQAWCVSQGGSAFIYVLDKSRAAEIAKQLQKEFAAQPGVTSVLTPESFAKLGLPAPESNSEAPQLILTTGPGYSFADNVAGDVVIDVGSQKGTHGHDPQPAHMHAMFVAAGAGIQPGVKLDVIQNVDVAPTIARLMGIPLKEVDGQVLEKILAK
ncbi:MAG TPA: ectonucleotide pyrophosphatase/phosphodiesterase [Pirellulaceae bacterium]|nr:ectonucleotide pyrophosphatase/phosphodiesterase [Pirellulaceae bacterium]